MTDNLKSLVKPLLLSSNYWIINKPILHALGLEATFLLSHFSEAENTIADKDGWFYQTIPTVEKMTTLSRFKKEEAINILIKKGILEQTNKGMPRKRYFKLNYNKIADIIVESTQNTHSYSMRETNRQVCEKLTGKYVRNSHACMRETSTNKEISNKEINNKEINKEMTSKMQSEKPTSKEEVVITNDFKNSLLEKWNSIKNIPNIKALRSGTKRYNSLKARLDEFSEDEILQAINNITKSDFLQGKNNRGWTITFDWFVKPNNFIKVLENQYQSNDTQISDLGIDESQYTPGQLIDIKNAAKAEAEYDEEEAYILELMERSKK
mgnify:FL=1